MKDNIQQHKMFYVLGKMTHKAQVKKQLHKAQ